MVFFIVFMLKVSTRSVLLLVAVQDGDLAAPQ